jgi:hypothetical protein
MRARTQIVIAAAVVALGLATLYLASTQSQSSVRFVEEVTARPQDHTTGAYTLMGIPEPDRIPLTGPNGTVLVPNPEYRNETRTTFVWQHGGEVFYSTHTVSVRSEGDAVVWSLRNETRHLPADAQLALPAVSATWRLGAVGQVFPLTAFTDPEHQRVWAWYSQPLEHPLQPKPSQFVGHLMTHLPDGTPLPAGALVYQVDEYTAGCSSKFLPPELQAKYGNQTASP